MKSEKLHELDVADLEQFLEVCEIEAARYEITVDYYIAEFL
tara:strand:+ start:56277 stop:56399 length:123 start_codon:yes stop_codon:yes gene_type:complete